MQITDVTTLKLFYQPPVAMADSVHYMPARPTLLVQVHTDAGITGLGESAAYSGFLESAEMLILGELRRLVVGQNPFDVERIWQRMAVNSRQRGNRGMLMMAISGIDIAIWDIIGQATNTPLYRIFGAYQDTLDGYASAGFYAAGKSPADLANEVAGYVERGFRFVKIKVGRNPEVMMTPLRDTLAADYATVSLEEDVERVRAVRQAIGPKVKLAIDANNVWTPSIALKFMHQVEQYDIYWLEEPIATDDLEGSALLAHHLDTPIAGYETETSLYGFRQLMVRGAIDIAQPDAIWGGGLTQCRKIAAMAQAFHLPVVPHGFSSAIAMIANMHLNASLPNAGLVEFDQNPNPLRSDLLEEPIDIDRNGRIAMPKGAGLGVKLNQTTINKYRVDSHTAIVME